MQSHDDEELGDEHGAGASTSEAATEVSLFLSLSQRDQGDRRTGMPLRTLKKYSIMNAVSSRKMRKSDKNVEFSSSGDIKARVPRGAFLHNPFSINGWYEGCIHNAGGKRGRMPQKGVDKGNGGGYTAP